MMSESTAVTQHLDQLHIPYTVFQHTGPVHSLEQAAIERGQRPSQVIRSILFRLTEELFIMVLVAGPGQIDWKTLRRTLGQSRLTMASEEEVWRMTGYQIGSVAPFGLSQPIRTLVDESVLAEEEVSLGSGVRGTAVILKTADLIQALEPVEVVNLSLNHSHE